MKPWSNRSWPRSARQLTPLALGVAVALSVASTAATVGVTEAIDLDSDSRFEVAVAGRVQLPVGVQSDQRDEELSVEPVGPTIDPNVTTTIATTTTAQQVNIVVNNAEAGRRGQAALNRIDYPWQDVLGGWTISFNGPRSDISGWIDFQKRHIYLYVRSGHSDTQVGHVLAHELGHAVDFMLVTPTERDQWLEARGIADQSWYPSAGSNDFSSPAGDFAEAFAVWQAGGSYQASLGGNPTSAQIALLEAITAP